MTFTQKLGLAGLITSVLGVCFYVGSKYSPCHPPYTPPNSNPKSASLSNLILPILRKICPGPINYIFPKVTVLMPPHPVPNPYPADLKRGRWPVDLDCAWRASYSKSLDKGMVEPKEQVSSLHVAAGGGNRDGIRRFIAFGQDVNGKDIRGQTPAYWAAYFGEAVALTLLRGFGANLDSVDHRGKTPLRAAVKYNHLEAVEVLATFNVDLNRKDGRGLTPLHLAAYKGHTQMLHKLIYCGADRTLLDPTGRTAEQVFRDRWEENYRNKWFFTRYFSKPTPPPLDFKPHTLAKLFEAQDKARSNSLTSART